MVQPAPPEWSTPELKRLDDEALDPADNRIQTQRLAAHGVTIHLGLVAIELVLQARQDRLALWQVQEIHRPAECVVVSSTSTRVTSSSRISSTDMDFRLRLALPGASPACLYGGRAPRPRRRPCRSD
jgi:hypothetical protein